MVNNIEELCDGVISHILSFLTIRDGFRARVSSRRWVRLPDTRSAVKLDLQNVFGKEIVYGDTEEDRAALESKFVKIVDHFMDIWAGKRMRTLVVKFALGKQHYGDVTRWIAKAVRMEVEDIDICVSSSSAEKYLFPCPLIQHEPYLKQLCLRLCTLSSLNSGWLSSLTTLELYSTPLDPTRMDLILSAGTNLVSIKLVWCDLPKYVWIDGQLLRLKKLDITGGSLLELELKLNCPSLEVFEYHGPVASMSFVHVPVLRDAKLWFPSHLYACSLMFNDHVHIQAPRLQTLSLMIGTQVIPYPPKLARFSLNELDIQVTRGFDLLSLTNLLNACPCLETLRVKMEGYNSNTNPTIGRGEYRDQSHYKLKQVKILRFEEQWNAMEFAKYLLTNAVALEQMLILARRHYYFRDKFESLHREINPTAQVIVLNPFYHPNSQLDA